MSSLYQEFWSKPPEWTPARASNAFTVEIDDEKWRAGSDSGSDSRLNTVIAGLRDPLGKLDVKI